MSYLINTLDDMCRACMHATFDKCNSNYNSNTHKDNTSTEVCNFNTIDMSSVEFDNCLAIFD